jgi:hypothetical protein
MHTLIVIAGGLVALAVFVIAAVLMRRPPSAGARLFLLPWLAAALFNLYLGTQHGYSVVSELPFFAIVFGIPALAALTVMRWARSAASPTR